MHFCISAAIYDALTDEQQDKLRGVASAAGVVLGDGVRMTDGINEWHVFIDDRVDCSLAANTAGLGAVMLTGNTVGKGRELADLKQWRKNNGVSTPANPTARDAASLNASIQAQGITPSQGYASDGSELTPVEYDI